MRCLTCGHELAEAANYCTDCGAPAPVSCPSCHYSNPSGARFCQQCGQRLPSVDLHPSNAAPPQAAPSQADSTGRAERRQLTVLFCDLVESAALSARLDPEDLRDVIGSYHRCVAETVARHEGFVARYMGDGALVYFGYPRGHEDNAERAVRAALSLVSAIAQLQVHGVQLRVRIGVATGLVVVGELVSVDAAREQIALGETPNLAARLQALAEPDTVLIAESTRQLIGGLFECRALGAVAFKGFDGTVPVWQVLGEHGVASRLLAVDARPAGETTFVSARLTPLVDRVEEFGLLRAGWLQAAQGSGRIVVLTGDAGIGKSRLVQALVEALRDEPHYELEFHCSAYHTNSPLYPVLHLLPRVVGLSRVDSDQTRFDKLEAFCDRHRLSATEALPLLAALLGLSLSSRVALPPMSPERQKQKTLQALLDVALSFADERPLLMVVEDLHWIDPTTMELLRLALNQVPGARIFSIFTARLPFQTGWPPHSHVMPIMLTRLARGDTEVMVQQVAAGKELASQTLQQIVSRTDGVPLFIEELTKAVLEAGVSAPDPARPGVLNSSIPATLQDSLMARLDRLGEGKAVAQLAAALGREFSYSMLSAVSELEEPTLQRHLDRLVDAEFLYQRGVPPEASYHFKHALIQEAAYQSLLRRSRQAYHRRIAEATVERFPSEADAHPEFVARQYTEGWQLDAALRWWQKAGQQAFARASYAEAINHYTMGLKVLHLLPASEQRDELELALQVELGYASIPPRGWAAVETAQAFTRAGELCRGLRDAAKQFRALWGLGAFHFVRGDQREARQIADQALAVASQSDDVDAAIEARYLSGIVSCAQGAFVPARDDLEECVRVYGDRWRDRHWMLYGQDAKASALGWLAMTVWALGDPRAAVTHAQQTVEWVRHSTQPFLHARAIATVGFVHFFCREPDRAEGPLRTAIDICKEQGFTYFGAVVSAFHGACLLGLGQRDGGLDVMKRSLGALRALGSEVLFTILHSELGAAQLALGLLDDGLATIDDGIRCVELNDEHWAESELHRVRGQLLLARGPAYTEDAEASFRRALTIAAEQHAKAYELRATICLARLWQQQRKHLEAKDLLFGALREWPESVDTVDLREARTLRVRCSESEPTLNGNGHGAGHSGL